MAKFCEHCGAELEDGTKFCDSCGNPTETTALQSYNPPPEKNLTTTIQISRKWRWVDLFFAENVYVDGIKIGKVSNGQSKIFEVQPGIHKLQLKMNWSFFSGFLRSRPTDFRIEEGNALRFTSDFTFGAFATITGFWMFSWLFSGFKVIKIEQDNS